MRIAFDGFVFDSDRRLLEHDGLPVHLSPKAYQLLECLVEAAPAAVSRDALYEKLWGETFVVDANLPNVVSEVRIVLGDSPREPKYIRTLHRHGYAFIGAALPPAASRFAVEWGTRSFGLQRGLNVLGRDEAANVRIDSAGVSRTHAAIVVRGEEASLEDRGSKNGTFVGDERIAAPRVLSGGDVIRLGSVRLSFLVRGGAESTMTEAIVPPGGVPRGGGADS
jgi:hypothetical protein